ncbi:MAG: Ppx/GppA phosphatase family protein, partial [Armatimonadota bacterium]
CHAAFDLGSNTARGILGRPDEDGVVRVLAADQRMTALGRGLEAGGGFERDALDETVQFVADTLQRWGSPGQVSAVATEAARFASNTDELLAALLSEAGVQAEVIEPREEARLAWLGAFAVDPPITAAHPALVDIGGRSVEAMTLEDGGLAAISRPLGARSFAESLPDSDLPWELYVVLHFPLIPVVLRDAIERVSGADVVVCTGGTAQAAARLLEKRAVSADEISGLLLELGKLPLEERRARMSFDPERAEIICAGLGILGAFAAAAPGDEIIVSDGGVREGLLLDRTGAERLKW